MKNNFRKLLVLVCMFACIFGLTACGSERDKKTSNKNITLDDETKQKLIEGFQEELKFLNTYTDDQLQDLIDLGLYPDEGVSIINSYMTVSDDLGSLKSIDASEITTTQDNVIVKLEATYAFRKMTCTTIYDADGNWISTKFEPAYTFGEKMSKAGMNTVIGLITVFAVLIGISFLISLFKFINVFENKRREKKTESAKAVDNTIAQIVEKEEAAADDLELVAVITAAIAAAEGTGSDGLVVRSIRKVNKGKWLNA